VPVRERCGAHFFECFAPLKTQCISLKLLNIGTEYLHRYTAERLQRLLAGVRDRFVGRALSLLHSRPSRAWTVNELAQTVGLSRSALAQRFTELVGKPPMQYLAQWCLQLAAKELSEGRKSLRAVATQVGYDSEAAFKREFGLPPSSCGRRALVFKSDDSRATKRESRRTEPQTSSAKANGRFNDDDTFTTRRPTNIDVLPAAN
jgi:AraC-like DNA-binding protein